MFVRTEEIDVIIKTEVTEDNFDLDTGEHIPVEEPEPTTILANIQPIGTKTLRRLPEGRRSDARFSMWTMTPLDLGTIAIYKGARLEAELAEDWNQPSSTIPHYKYILYREGTLGHNIVTGGDRAKQS